MLIPDLEIISTDQSKGTNVTNYDFMYPVMVRSISGTPSPMMKITLKDSFSMLSPYVITAF